MRLDVYVSGFAESTRKRGVGAMGGWSYVGVADGEIILQESGSKVYATEYRMNLLAAQRGCEAAEKLRASLTSPITECHIYTSSKIIIDCYEKCWWENWIVNGWEKFDETPVKESTLWSKIVPYFKNRMFGFHFTKYYGDKKYVKIGEELAYQAALQMKDSDE